MGASFEFFKLNTASEQMLLEAYKKDVEWQTLIDKGDYSRADETEYQINEFLDQNSEKIEFSTSFTFANEIEENLNVLGAFELGDNYKYIKINNSSENIKVMENTEIYQEKWKYFFDTNSILLYTVSK